MMYAEQRNWEARFTEKWFWTKAQFDMLQRLHAISLSGNRAVTLSWLCFAFCQCHRIELFVRPLTLQCSVFTLAQSSSTSHHMDNTDDSSWQPTLDSSVKYITCENWPQLMNSWHCWHVATFTIQLLSKVILAF